MFIKLKIGKPGNEEILINTDHIVMIEPQGKSFRVHLYNTEPLVVDSVQYAGLIAAIRKTKKIKQ